MTILKLCRKTIFVVVIGISIPEFHFLSNSIHTTKVKRNTKAETHKQPLMSFWLKLTKYFNFEKKIENNSVTNEALLQGNIFIPTRQEYNTKEQKKKKSTVFSTHRECCRIILNNKSWPINSPISPAIVCSPAVILSPETQRALTLTRVNPKLRIPCYMYDLHVGSISEKSTIHMYYNKIHTKCSISESMPLRSTYM